MVAVKDVISVMEKIAPSHLAMEKDRVGLQVGDEDTCVDAILISLDVTEDVIEEARKRRANLILAHHPLIYQPLNNLIFSKPPCGIIKKAAKYDISIYVAHTNLDITSGGVNDVLLKILEKDLKIEKVRPLLDIEGKPGFGLGKISSLKEAKTLRKITLMVKKSLSAANIKVCGKENAEINKIALCGGSCKELVYPAWQKGAKLFITGELSYHSLLEAKSLNLSVIEAGHYETEVVVLPFLKKRLEKEFKEKGWSSLKLIQSNLCTNPYLTENLS